MKKRPHQISIHAGQFEFVKINAGRQDWRDIYHWVLALSWPQFVAFISGVYLAINLLFAALYATGDNCIDGLRHGALLDAFFSAWKPSPPSATATCFRPRSTGISSPPWKSWRGCFASRDNGPDLRAFL